MALEGAAEVAVLDVVFQQQVGDLVRDRETDRSDTNDACRDDDPCAVAELDHARLRAFEILEHDLSTELVGECFNIDGTRPLRPEPRDRLERASACFGVTQGFGRFDLRRLPQPFGELRHLGRHPLHEDFRFDESFAKVFIGEQVQIGAGGRELLRATVRRREPHGDPHLQLGT